MATSLAADAFMTVDEVRDSGACDGCLLDASDAQVLAWTDQASDLIAILSGMRVFGRYSLIARPCRYGVRGYCDCCHLDAIPLGDMKPTIDSVWIDGVEMPSDEYQLHWGLNGWSLVRIGDGTARPPSWPSWQELWLADTEEHTFAVYFTVGYETDQAIVQSAVLETVCDIATDALNGYQNPNELAPGIIQAQIGNTTVVVDPDRLARMQAGELGPAMTKLLGVYAPGGRQSSAVYAPELTNGWSLNLRVPPVEIAS